MSVSRPSACSLMKVCAAGELECERFGECADLYALLLVSVVEGVSINLSTVLVLIKKIE